MRIPRPSLPALAAVVGAWLGFANPFLQIPPLALLLPAGLMLVGLRAETPGQAFRGGFLTALAAFTGCLYWIVVPVHEYGYLPWLVALPCPPLVASWLALWAGLFSMGMRMAKGRLPGAALGLLAGGLWGCLELAAGTVLTGFPWLPLAAAFAAWDFLLWPVPWVGGLGLGVLLAAAACMLASPPWDRLHTWARDLGALLLVVYFVAGLTGAEPPHAAETPNAPGATEEAGIPVLAVQGNIDQSLKWDLAYQDDTVERYVALSEGAVERQGRKPALVVWPETALPFYFQDLGLTGAKVRSLARRLDTYLLTGAPAYTLDIKSGGSTLYNRAYLLGHDGGTVASYDKMHLVPFGEYVPLGEYLPLGKLVEGVGDFRPGTDTKPLPAGDLAVGVLICYETIFPELAQDRVEQGANVLVNISNDAWFGRTSAPLQHLHLSALRAAEQGRWLLRATNTGISALIDPHGRITATTDTYRAATLSGTLLPRSETTFFHRHFQAVRIGTGLLTALLAALALLRGRSPQGAANREAGAADQEPQDEHAAI